MNYNNKEEVVKDYAKFITFVLKKMNLFYRQDDLFDIGMIGFVRGLNTYDESKKYNYSTYLFSCIKNEILKVIDYERRPIRDVKIISLNMPVGEDDYKITELQEMIPYYENNDDKIFTSEIIFDIMRFLGGCTKRQEDIFKYLYGIDGYPQLTIKQIAIKFNTSRQSIANTHKTILKKLKAFLEKKGYYEE